MELLQEIELEAAAAKRAAASLTDEAVASALRSAAALVRERRAAILEANRTDVAAAELTDAMFDRLRLDEGRVDALAAQVEALAGLEPLAREVGAWTLPNGLQVDERRIPMSRSTSRASC
jgi:glutamate-5-semialdehyde dehydrogenase